MQTSTYNHIYDGLDVIVQASKHNNGSMMLKLLARNSSRSVKPHFIGADNTYALGLGLRIGVRCQHLASHVSSVWHNTNVFCLFD